MNYYSMIIIFFVLVDLEEKVFDIPKLSPNHRQYSVTERDHHM